MATDSSTGSPSGINAIFGGVNLFTSIISGIAKASQSETQAQVKKINLQAQADIDQMNASLQHEAAQRTMSIMAERQAQIHTRTSQIKSAQRSAFAGSGVSLASTTAINLRTETEHMAELDLMTIEVNAIDSAWGHRIKATRFELDAKHRKQSAKRIKPGEAFMNTLLGQTPAIASQTKSFIESIPHK